MDYTTYRIISYMCFLFAAFSVISANMVFQFKWKFFVVCYLFLFIGMFVAIFFHVEILFTVLYGAVFAIAAIIKKRHKR